MIFKVLSSWPRMMIVHPQHQTMKDCTVKLAVLACVIFIGVELYSSLNSVLSVSPRHLNIPNSPRLDDDELKNILHGTIQRRVGSVNESIVGRRSVTYGLWKEDGAESPCAAYHTRLGVDLPQVRLVSFPCSGNTWTRYLLEATTGIFTGSIYTDRDLYKGGFLGEKDAFDSGHTIVQKTHAASFINIDLSDYDIRYSHIEPDLPAILLIRDPAKTLISFWKYKVTKGSHTRQVPEAAFNTPIFHKYVITGLAHWETLILDRLLWSRTPVFVLYYEDLLTNTIPTLRGLLDFLGVEADEGRLKCVTSHMTGRFRRKGNTEFDPFTSKEKFLLNAAATKINITVKLLGYKPLPQY